MKPTIAFSLLMVGSLAAATFNAAGENWPCWRGPRGDGTSTELKVPTNWDPTNALWKVELPGLGHASAIVWDKYVCTATALPDTQERVLLCFDRATGKKLWQQTVVTGALEKKHDQNSYASSTPATDGQTVFATFRVGDDIVVAAHELATGKQLWIVRPGTHVGEWGYNNEPVLYKDKIILDGDSKGESFLIALNKADGKTAWRVDRANKGISYSAPLIRQLAGKTQMIQCGDRRVTSFDPDTGKEYWTVDGPSQEFVATPVYSEKTGLIYISSSWPKTMMMAIRPDGSGNVTQTHVVWKDDKGAPYVPSLLTTDNYLFSINNQNDASVFCYEASTGAVMWQEKVGRHHASPTLAGGLVWLINDDGQINVFKPGPKYASAGKFELGESCYASPAVSDGQVFVRGFHHLYCFEFKSVR